MVIPALAAAPQAVAVPALRTPEDPWLLVPVCPSTSITPAGWTVTGLVVGRTGFGAHTWSPPMGQRCQVFAAQQ